MPEGPQMVFLKEQAEQFVGQTVLLAEGSAKHVPNNRLQGQVLTEIKTYGKEFLFCFSSFAICIHLMLFGKYAINSRLDRELRLGLEFETGEINFYACDCRLIEKELSEVYDWSTDVMSTLFDKAKALEKLHTKPERQISDAILDQSILAGVGNGIKNEVLYRRQIHPESMVGAIPEVELLKLVNECVKLSFEYLTWIREGTAKQHWQVYQKKEGPRDFIPLQKGKTGKQLRSSYYCDRCQRLFLPDVL